MIYFSNEFVNKSEAIAMKATIQSHHPVGSAVVIKFDTRKCVFLVRSYNIVKEYGNYLVYADGDGILGDGTIRTRQRFGLSGNNVETANVEDVMALIKNHFYPSFKVDGVEYAANVCNNDIIPEWGDSHDPKLRKAFNGLYKRGSSYLNLITKALYERDAEEISIKAADNDDDVFEQANEYTYEEMLSHISFEELLSYLANHIWDNNDLQLVLYFCNVKVD